MMLMVMFHAVLFHAMPRFSRPDILFAVTVSDAFAAGDGRRILTRYRIIVWCGAAAAVAFLLLMPVTLGRSERGAWAMMAAVAGNLLVGLGAWLWAHRAARPHAVPHSDTRTASLVPRDTSLPGGALFASGPFVILLAAAVLVWMNWDRVPAGSARLGPFAPLAFGGVFVAIMLTMAVSLARRTRQVAVDGLAAAAEQRFRRVNVLVAVLSAYGAAIMLSLSTLASISELGQALTGISVYAMLPLMLFNVGVVIWMFRVGQGGQRAIASTARSEVHGDATPDRAWKVGGLFYFNPNDPAIWVEKRIGFGYTLNIGNPAAWLLVVAMMVVPMVAMRFFF
jgi:uncharacterized membrane protein